MLKTWNSWIMVLKFYLKGGSVLSATKRITCGSTFQMEPFCVVENSLMALVETIMLLNTIKTLVSHMVFDLDLKKLINILFQAILWLLSLEQFQEMVKLMFTVMLKMTC